MDNSSARKSVPITEVRVGLTYNPRTIPAYVPDVLTIGTIRSKLYVAFPEAGFQLSFPVTPILTIFCVPDVAVNEPPFIVLEPSVIELPNVPALYPPFMLIVCASDPTLIKLAGRIRPAEFNMSFEDPSTRNPTWLEATWLPSPAIISRRVPTPAL